MRPFKSYILIPGLAMCAAIARAADAPKPRGLMAMLQKAMTGHSVVAVGEGPWQTREAHYDEVAFAAAKDELGRLQVISTAASSDEMPMIPFAVGKAWVIAPQYRQDLNTDFRGLSADAMRSQDQWLTRALLALPPEQMARAADGIAFSDLPKESQAALTAALRPPFRVMTPRKTWLTFPDGQRHEVSDAATLARVTEAPDWSKVRLRARLRLEGARVTRSGTNQIWTLGHQFENVPFLMPDVRSANGRIAAYSDVPNAFRPSDLNAEAFHQPIGLSGIHPVKDVVARLAKATGLRLHAMRSFEKAPVFLGREDLSCGDVMDGIRLAVTGTWRRIGDDYILAWDKPGWAADKTLIDEAAGDLYNTVHQKTLEDGPDPAWLTVAENLPFAPDDPLAYTDDQRRKLFRLDWKPGDPAWLDGGDGPDNDPNVVRIPYDRMTPEQQAFLRGAAKTEEISIYHGRGQPMEKQPFTSADIAGAVLDNISGPVVDISVNLPDFGWVHQMDLSGPVFGGDSLGYGTLLRIRQHINREAERPKREAERKAGEKPYAPKASTLPAQSRGLLVPALGPSEVTELIGRMKVHGLDTLFYPALDGGYATFQSKAFPLAPALRGASGWAAASSAAKEHGIRLVAWLSPVAWQNAGQKVHWLDKHPGWLEVDALGRTHLQWWEQYAEGKSPEQQFMRGLFAVNYVRPTEPEVARRLDLFLDECARLPGTAGLCVLDWRPPPPPEYWEPDTSPPLGFALPDRVAALARTGYDPLDEQVQLLNTRGPWETPRVMGLLGNYDLPKPEREDAPYATLATRVLQRARALRKDWTTYRVDVPHEERPPETDVPTDPPPASRPAPPQADVALSVFTSAAAGYEGFTMPLPPRSFMRADVFPPEARNYPALATVGDEPASRWHDRPPAKVALYDFRPCPEEIMDSLRWIAPPDNAKTPKTETR